MVNKPKNISGITKYVKKLYAHNRKGLSKLKFPTKNDFRKFYEPLQKHQ